MNRTILIIIGIACAVITAAGIMEFEQRDIYKARRQLHSESSWVRGEALSTLIIHNDSASIPEIIRLLKNNDLKTRLDAIGALGVCCINTKTANYYTTYSILLVLTPQYVDRVWVCATGS